MIDVTKVGVIGCTPVEALWCPHHGNCTCPNALDPHDYPHCTPCAFGQHVDCGVPLAVPCCCEAPFNGDLNDDHCQLHSYASRHPLPKEVKNVSRP